MDLEGVLVCEVLNLHDGRQLTGFLAGRPFAWQEMMLVMALLFQFFNFTLDDSQYTLQVAFTLTIKPKDLKMRATLRDGWTARSIEQSLGGSVHGDQPTSKEVRIIAMPRLRTLTRI